MASTHRHIKLPRLFGLTPGHVRQTMQDLEYINRCYRIVLAIHSHELFDYCFPVNPIYGRPQTNPEQLGESQAGLSHLFEAEDRERPIIILTPEHHDEVNSIIEGIRQKAPDAWDHVLRAPRHLDPASRPTKLLNATALTESSSILRLAALPRALDFREHGFRIRSETS